MKDAGNLDIIIDATIHDNGLSIIFEIILGIKADVKILFPLFIKKPVIISIGPPASPPNNATDIGVPIKGATTASIIPVIIATGSLNPNFLEISPTTMPITIFTMAKGSSVGLLTTDVIKFVTKPVIAPKIGPSTAATSTVPITSKKTKGILRCEAINDNTIFNATPTAQKVNANVLIFIEKILSINYLIEIGDGF